MQTCQIKGLPTSEQSLVFIFFSPEAAVRSAFLNDKQEAVLGVCSVLYYYPASQARPTVIKLMQGGLVLQGPPLYACFCSYIVFLEHTVLLQTPAVVPETEVISPTPRGSSRTSAGCQTQLGEPSACALSPSVLLSPPRCCAAFSSH